MSIQVNPRSRLPCALLLLGGSSVGLCGAGWTQQTPAPGVAPTHGVAPAHDIAPAQLILLHGHILTVDSRDSIAEALAIRDGKIIAVGTDDEILRLSNSVTQRIDLKGRTATPGLIDSHAHIA